MPTSGADTPFPWSQPTGATPLDPDEAEGLLPAHIMTQGALNSWEQLNIAVADRWATASRRSTATVLSRRFAEELHRRVFDRTWTWAGSYRRTGKNMGLPPHQLQVALVQRLDDAAHWRTHAVHPIDEIAARLHHQLVLIHPWPNGNGRWSRLMADALMHAEGRPRFSWGGADIDRTTQVRADYLAALRAADRGDLQPLLHFVRR